MVYSLWLFPLTPYLLYGAESYLRSKPVFSSSRNSPHFMEPEGTLPYSQGPATCPYPEPARSSPYPHIPLPEDPSWRFPLKFAIRSFTYFPSTCYITRQLICLGIFAEFFQTRGPV